MEEAKAEVEKRVSTLLKFIQNKKNIPTVTKKELVLIVNDLHERCNLLCSACNDLEINGIKGKVATASSSTSDSDLEYYSSEEIDVSAAETSTSDYMVMLKKLQEPNLRNEYLNRQVSDLNHEIDFLRDQNMELAGDVKGKTSEDTERFKGLITKGEATLLRSQIKELELGLEKKSNEVSATHMRLKGLEEEIERRAKAELRIVEEKEDLWNKVEKLVKGVDGLKKQRKKLSEDMKCKISEIFRLKEDNKKLYTRIAQLDSLKNIEIRNIGEIEDTSNKFNKEQENIIHRLSMEIKEQKDVIDKFTEEQKLMRRWSFGSKPINTNLLERKMEELAEDYRKKVEDHIRILYRRIQVAEQIHLENKINYIKNTQENRGEYSQFKEIVEKGLVGPEMAIKKLEEGVNGVTSSAKKIDSARKWVKEKKNEVETLEARLECREAQESLLKEKLSKLEKKLAEEGTGKLSLDNAMRRIKMLEIDVNEKEYELVSLSEGKREAIRQLCVLIDYQRCRYDDLKTSIFKVALEA